MLEIPRHHPEVPNHPGPYWHQRVDRAHVYCPKGHHVDLTGYVVLRDGSLFRNRRRKDDLGENEILCGAPGCGFRCTPRLKGWHPCGT